MDISAWIESQGALFTDLSDRIWECAELGFSELQSSELLASALERTGFELRRGVAGMPTAFVASFGSGKPVIAILGEFDALPGLSQERLPEEKPIIPGGSGHGCGHNLLGVAGLAAALGVQRALQAGGLSGTVRYYGCPAEENGAGKVFMVKAGLFEDVDLSLCWHPDTFNGVMTANALAVVVAVFRFHGRAAHAAYDPYNGRSALDAVELMNVGANYLREHIIPDGRLHYVITNGGGPAPNVVPPLAESKYLVRAPLMPQADEIYRRLLDVGRGAALMTGTEMEIVVKKGMSNLVLIPEINQVLYEKMVEVGAPQFTVEEAEFARRIAQTFTTEEAETLLTKMYGGAARTLLEQTPDRALFTPILPNMETDYVVPGSTDVGDVSWVTPTGQVETVCAAFGTPGHSWQTVAQSGMGIGHKGMLYAGKIMALAAVEFMSRPERLEKARREFNEKIKKAPYVCPIPDGVKPF